jgi:hypothetical protein
MLTGQPAKVAAALVLAAWQLFTAAAAMAQQGLGPAFAVSSLSGVGSHGMDVATGPDGEFMVVWQSASSAGSDSDLDSIQARRFDANGAALGGQFQVNSAAAGRQQEPKVLIDDNGEAVVVWTNSGDIAGQRFDVSGNFSASEFAVANTSDNESQPDIAMAPGGVSTVVWRATQVGQAFITYQIWSRRYDAMGAPLAPAFEVTSATGYLLSVGSPSVSAADDGSAVIAWGLHSIDLGFIRAQRFDSAGAPVGGQFEPNLGGTAAFPHVEHDGLGRFIIGWVDTTYDPHSITFRMRRHDASGIAVGPFLEVPGLTEEQPDLAVDASGASLVIWPQLTPDASGPPPYTEQVLGQRFTPSGKPSGQPFEVTPSSTPRNLSIGSGPAVAFDAEGEGVVVWAADEDPAQEGYSFAILGRRGRVSHLPALGGLGLLALAVMTFVLGMRGVRLPRGFA